MYNLRNDTEQEPVTNVIIEEERQQFIGCLAMRGEGKSYLLESYAEQAFLKGYTVLDLHGADNLENAFWVFPSREKGVKNPLRIPITLIAQESIVYDQKQLDHFNSRPMTEQEWYGLLPYETYHKLYNCADPPRVRLKKNLVEVKTIPPVSMSKAEYETETNQKAIDRITQIILNCRDNRRVFVLNRVMFASEKQYFWTLELIMRNLVKIAEKHFLRLEPKDVGKPDDTPRHELQGVVRNWHKMIIVTRELGELCPSRSLKGDQSGESLSVKKAFFNFIRKARHYQIDWIADWQRNNDVEDAIRSQADKMVFKRYNRDLGGDDNRPFFDQLSNLREAVANKHGPIMGKYINLNNYPQIEKLDKKYQYLWISQTLHLKTVRKVRHLHKEPYHRFFQESGIEFSHDWKKVKDEKEVGKSKTLDKDVALIYTIVKDLKNPEKSKKKLKTTEIIQKLDELQQQGKINYHLQFSDMTPPKFHVYFARWREIYEKLNTPTVKK